VFVRLLHAVASPVLEQWALLSAALICKTTALAGTQIGVPVPRKSPQRLCTIALLVTLIENE
jgi:hypothetical protein